MFRLIWFWLTLARHVTCNCGPPPLAIPITNVPLSNGQVRRGILGSIGTPAQNISFTVHAQLNDTWVYNSTDTFCDVFDATGDQCLTLRGGLYDTEKSSSYIHQDDVYVAGADPSDTGRAIGTHIWYNAWSTDNLVISNATLTDYPIGMPGFDFGGTYNRQAAIGMGQNSTLLQRLKDQGSIASRSWSYWWGIDNSASRSAMDGQMVFGGYDAAKVVGKPFTQQLQNATANCQSGMYLTFTNMLLNFPNGTTRDINPLSVITGCVQPDFPTVMSIPAEPYFWAFQNVTETGFMNRSVGTYWFMPTYPPSDVYAGDLEIQIQGGPAITIPNDVLVVPDQYTDAAGVVQDNSSAGTLMLSPNDGPNVNDIPLIGMSFFSGAYLSVNLDNRTWSIWPAKATTDTEIITIGANKCEEKTNVTMFDVPTNKQPGDQSSDRPSDANVEETRLSTKAIAGIAAGGGAAVLGLLGLAAFLLLRKRKRNRSLKEIPSVSSASQPDGFAAYDRRWQDEMHLMQEMVGSQTVPYELKTDEKPVEMGQNDRWHWKRGQVYESPVELPAGPF
ncbi:Putative aspartic peptidase A1 family, aspartic peptidase domain superfamily [Septoria linicola]|uniref:Aspartic peptidase A1 family, aspartic peptidase domain superfamily n=1 Tax=Septoria linicola TaxID=215465 RepID=A0A9Q9AX70_9PEZI|nr:Putative aspartic peptidase A1 family, aspartic peptidase domain superfamily [Septoria linicola]